MTSFIYSVFAYLIVLAACLPAKADPLSGLILGVVLDHFSDRVESALSHAGGQARSTVITAAGEANAVINNARVAYRDSLNDTLKEGQNTLYTTMQGINSIVSKLENQTNSDALDVIAAAQQISLILPLTAKDPQIRNQSPKITSVSGNNNLLLKISGVFFYAKDPEYMPYLEINNKKFEPSGTATNEIIFELSKNELKQPISNEMTITRAKLGVPYKENTFLWSKKINGEFLIPIGLLPKKAGIVSVSARHTISTEEVQTVTSSGIGLSSEHCCDKEEDVCDPAQIPAGWRYVANSAQMINLHEIGGSRKYNDWDEKGPRVSTHVCWHVITWQHHHGTDGNVDFQLRYDIARINRVTKDDVITSYEAEWGEGHAIKLPEDTTDWVVTYSNFDGTLKTEISEPSSTNPPFITVSRPSPGTLQIITAPPPEF